MTGRGRTPQEAQPSYPGIRFPPRHPGQPRDSFQSSALCFSPAVTGRLGSFCTAWMGECSQWQPQPPQRTVISAALAGPSAGRAGLCSRPPVLSFPSTYFFLKSQKGFLKPFPGGFEAVWRQKSFSGKEETFAGPQSVA